jgi:DNA mismatch endonuclease (patch repair protein)
MDSKTAKLIKSKNTAIEMILRRKLYSLGYRYRIHSAGTHGKPDIVFSGKKIAVFCDSAFWHGKKYLEGEKFKTNNEFWEHKITRNIERDAKVNNLLTQNGWRVLRFWDHEIKKDLDGCIKQIKSTYETQGNK